MGKPCKLPTCLGVRSGVSIERRESKDGNRYYIVLYNRQAQESIVRALSG